jgi:predicted methyltransferase
MKRSAITNTALALTLCLGACAHSNPAPATDTIAVAATNEATAAKIDAALAGAHRPEKDRVRDPARHPKETLTFFGLRDDMTVVELWPGGGWYTNVLAPVLKEKGKLVTTSFDPNGAPEAYNTKRAKELAELLEKNKEIFGNVQIAVVNPPESVVLGAPGSADLVVTFRNLHNWITAKPPYAEKVLAASFAVLKPGGVLGIVEHRANPGMPLKSGYVEQAETIRLAEAAGFKLEAQSEVNANPKDTKDHPEGVWTLPPALRLGDKDREKYVAIGESDRMTLKFVKPR